MDARTQIRSIFRNMLRIQHAADGRLPPQGAAGGVSKQVPTLRCAHRATGDALLNFLQFVRISEYDLAYFLAQDKPENLSCHPDFYLRPRDIWRCAILVQRGKIIQGIARLIPRNRSDVLNIIPNRRRVPI